MRFCAFFVAIASLLPSSWAFAAPDRAAETDGAETARPTELADLLGWLKDEVEGVKVHAPAWGFGKQWSLTYDSEGNVSMFVRTELLYPDLKFEILREDVRRFHLSDIDPKSIQIRVNPLSVMMTTENHGQAVDAERIESWTRTGDDERRSTTRQRFATTFVIVPARDQGHADALADALERAIDLAQDASDRGARKWKDRK